MASNRPEYMVPALLVQDVNLAKARDYLVNKAVNVFCNGCVAHGLETLTIRFLGQFGYGCIYFVTMA